MAMHFIFSDTAVLLFDFWSVHSPAGMALSVLVLLLLAVLYEGIKVGKAKLLNQVLVNLPTSISQQTIAETDGDSAGSDSFPVGRTHHRVLQFPITCSAAAWSVDTRVFFKSCRSLSNSSWYDLRISSISSSA
uniref:Copper transport protein n=1 Tax=Pongo abelii TaxID=9601 RepID=A0A8I5YR95_PONAB